MTSYQIGQLVGALIGAVSGFALAYKLFKSPKKANRVLGVVAALFAFAYIGSAALKHGPGRRRKDFEAGFRGGCVKTCTGGKSEQSACTAYCDCQLSKLLSGADVDHVIQSFAGVRSAADLGPEQRAQVAAAAAECMPPEMYDANFMATCTSACSDPACPTKCRCLLDKFREGMGPAAGTRWMIENIDTDPPTPEGEVRTSAAVAACDSTAAVE